MKKKPNVPFLKTEASLGSFPNSKAIIYILINLIKIQYTCPVKPRKTILWKGYKVKLCDSEKGLKIHSRVVCGQLLLRHLARYPGG